MSNGNSPSGEAAQMPASATSKWGLGREARAALLRVRIEPECPEGNLRELTWASKTRLWDSYHVKSPNLRHRQACSQNKGLSRASQLPTGPSASGDRQTRAAKAGRGQLWPQRGIVYQTASRLHCYPRFLGILNSQHPPEKMRRLYTQKTKQQGPGRQ